MNLDVHNVQILHMQACDEENSIYMTVSDNIIHLL